MMLSNDTTNCPGLLLHTSAASITGMNASPTRAAPIEVVVGYLVLINFVGSFVQGITTFGDAIIIQIMWHALASATGEWMHTTPLGNADVQIAALLQYSRTIVLNPLVACLAYRGGARYVPMKLVVAAMVPQVLSTIFGEQLLLVVPHQVLKVWFGIGCLCFAFLFVSMKVYRSGLPAYLILKSHGRQVPLDGDDGLASPEVASPEMASPEMASPEVAFPEVASPTTRLDHVLQTHPAMERKVQVATAITSAISGLTGALTGIGGPPFMILILLFDLPPPFVRLLFPVATLPSVYVRYALALRDGLITRDMLPYHGISVCAGVVGVLCGNRIGRCVGPKTFNVVVLVLLILAALVMLVDIPLLSLVMLALGVAVMGVTWWQDVDAESQAAASAGTLGDISVMRPQTNQHHHMVDMQVEDIMRMYDLGGPESPFSSEDAQ
jgi:uncharacterized membrane protein YfcA